MLPLLICPLTSFIFCSSCRLLENLQNLSPIGKTAMENAFFFSIKNTENVVVFGIKHHCDIKIKACTSELAPPHRLCGSKVMGIFFFNYGNAILFYLMMHESWTEDQRIYNCQYLWRLRLNVPCIKGCWLNVYLNTILWKFFDLHIPCMGVYNAHNLFLRQFCRGVCAVYIWTWKKNGHEVLVLHL